MSSADPLYLQIAESIACAIRSGALGRGARLDSVRDTARARNVSMATVVQAYRSLEDAHLIEARPRSGYFVAARPAPLPEPETSRPPADSLAVDVSSLSATVMRMAREPGVMSFGAACPDVALFDQERVRRAVSRAAQRHRATLCQYPLGPGDAELRRAIARHALSLGCTLAPDDVLITNGCLDAITLCLRAVTQPGDVVALESPCYFGFLEILEHLHLRALEIPTHPRTGLSLDALQLAFDTQPVKAVLAVPTLSNPLGACMPLAERQRLARMVAERGVPLIEDVIHSGLAERDEQRRAVHSYDTSGHVMLCGSFGKTLAPGLRLGWLDAGRWRSRVQRLKAATSGGHTTFLERALADLLNQPGNEASSRRLRGTMAARIDEARGLIAQSFPAGTRVTDPPGGYVLWVELPTAIDSLALYRVCLAEHICIAPGTMFSATGRFRHCIRLGIGGAWNDAQRTALRRVGTLAKAMLPAASKAAERGAVLAG
jgi:DNA-binding transcriptional MocR family regulator